MPPTPPCDTTDATRGGGAWRAAEDRFFGEAIAAVFACARTMLGWAYAGGCGWDTNALLAGSDEAVRGGGMKPPDSTPRLRDSARKLRCRRDAAPTTESKPRLLDPRRCSRCGAFSSTGARARRSDQLDLRRAKRRLFGRLDATPCPSLPLLLPRCAPALWRLVACLRPPPGSYVLTRWEIWA